MKDIAVVNACSDLGVHISGSSLAPEIITKDIENNKYTIKTMNCNKEYDIDNKKKNLKFVNEFNERLYLKVKELVNEDYLPITVGGDHSIAIATALASISRYENLGIIWFDAHGDFNTFETTISGNIHGIPLATITNYEKNFLNYFHERKLLSL